MRRLVGGEELFGGVMGVGLDLGGIEGSLQQRLLFVNKKKLGEYVCGFETL